MTLDLTCQWTISSTDGFIDSFLPFLWWQNKLPASVSHRTNKQINWIFLFVCQTDLYAIPPNFLLLERAKTTACKFHLRFQRQVKSEAVTRLTRFGFEEMKRKPTNRTVSSHSVGTLQCFRSHRKISKAYELIKQLFSVN